MRMRKRGKTRMVHETSALPLASLYKHFKGSSNSFKETYSSTGAEIPPECVAAAAIASTCTTSACTATAGAQAACFFGEAYKES